MPPSNPCLLMGREFLTGPAFCPVDFVPALHPLSSVSSSAKWSSECPLHYAAVRIRRNTGCKSYLSSLKIWANARDLSPGTLHDGFVIVFIYFITESLIDETMKWIFGNIIVKTTKHSLPIGECHICPISWRQLISIHCWSKRLDEKVTPKI